MSLDVQRDGAFASRKHELASASRAQSASLLALQAVTALLTNNTDLSSLLTCTYDPDNTSALNPEQLVWLKTHSLAHGRRFDETTLSLPHINEPIANKPSTPTSTADELVEDATSHIPSEAKTTGLSTSHTTTLPQDGHSAASTRNQPTDSPRVTRASSHIQPESKKTSDCPLTEISPPEPDEQAHLDSQTQDLLGRETPKKPAKTVHLPPEKAQEERLQNVVADKRRPSSSDAEKQKGAPPSSHHRARSDAASSPSSTVGAYSATTPMPAQDSPNTSPDSETAAVEIPLEFRPTPAEQRAKEEHDRNLAAQKTIAHDAALGDVNTPDDQLKWEEREAAAREAEERAATSDHAGPEPNASSKRSETEAEAVVSGKEADADANVTSEQRTERNGNKDAVSVVTPRADPPIIRPPLARQSTQPSSAAQTPQSAKLDDHFASPSAVASQRRSSTAVLSPPNLQRKDNAAPSQAATTSLASPSSSRTLPSQILHELLSDLASLRGAAEDPDRDYLESLFRIQAHDSPHIRTSPLPELLKSASKTISTDDHFASLHERMEYRILRRIYHLQNANKWSLRQMVKCDEPPPSVSQHDHMMAEMKWMCKDFRAERKRKKSVCNWLAQRCAEWVAADKEERTRLQVKLGPTLADSDAVEDDGVPELDESGSSPPQLDVAPGTPKDGEQILTRLVVDPELLSSVLDLQRNGALPKALKELPLWQPETQITATSPALQPMTEVSKFVNGKVLPKLDRPMRKRGRYDFEDEEEAEHSEEHTSKRSRLEADLPPEDPNVAIFHADNKAIRDRLHAQNAFRPPSEFQMPTVAFYEFRYGSYWLAEDDHKLRRLAKDYAFNWSAIADQMALPSRYKSGFDRRTPWECFERWVELEQMPAEMRKTVYFKTWYSRLDQSQQAVEKRYQAQLAHVQAQSSQSGIAPQQQPVRRRTMPTRVEKRKNQRYIWTVDAMRKNAKKRELAAYKQAEATRAAAQRKASQQGEPQQLRQQTRLTPQQFSQKRYERDVAMAKMQQAQREKIMEQQRQAQAARLAAQQGLANGIPPQQRAGMPQAVQNAQGQLGAQAAINAAQLTPQQRQQLQQMAARNGQFSGPQINGQNVPQAQMQAATAAQQQTMQRMAAQYQAQARNGLTGQQQQQIAAMQNGNAGSPGPNGLTQQQQYANNQALLAAYKAQQQQAQQQSAGVSHNQGASQSSPQQQQAMAASPSMGPPPMPANTPQQLSSGHVPAVIKIQNQLRATYPQMTEEQLRAYATERLKSQSAQRTNAMNAAAGLNNTNVNGASNNARAYQHNQVNNNSNAANTGNSNQQNGTMMSNGTSNYSPQDGSPQASMAGNSGSTQHSYAQMMRQRQMAQMAHMQQAQSNSHNASNGSPVVAHSSPIMNPASPSMQFSNMAGQRPPSRSATPQMQRLGSSGGVPGVAVSGMQSPGASSLQASPRGVQANMAR